MNIVFPIQMSFATFCPFWNHDILGNESIHINLFRDIGQVFRSKQLGGHRTFRPINSKEIETCDTVGRQNQAVGGKPGLLKNWC